MESEKTFFAKKNVPRYTFFEGGIKPSNMNSKKCHCCIIATILLLIILVALITILVLVHNQNFKANVSNDLQHLDHLLNLTWPLPEEKFSNNPSISPEYRKKAIKRGLIQLYEKERLESDVPSVPMNSPAFRSQLATYTSPEAQNMSRFGYLMNFSTKEINELCLKNLSTDTTLPEIFQLDGSIDLPEEICKSKNVYDCDSFIYRSADGTCNNLKHKSWGSAFTPFRRILLPKYNDGVSEPRLASDGTSLPSPRKISLTIARPAYANDSNFTVMLAVWGQFIDHDITGTALSKGKNGTSISCCNSEKKHPECFPVMLETSDPFYEKYNITCMEFIRSAPAPLCKFAPREQLNQVTSYLDGSVVYGSSKKIMNKLRTFKGGELKMLKTSAGELLPVAIDPNDGCNMAEEIKRGRYCFLSGDARSNENLLLISMHLLFARQHNLISRKLKQINPHYSDEKLFQESRKILGAQIQHITYNEFLPSVLPWNLLKYRNMTIKHSGYSQNYNSSINPEISNSFASAAFRFGHSLLPGLIQFLKHNSSHEEYLELHKMLFNPFKLYELKFLTNLLRGTLNTPCQKADIFFSSEITQKLFKKEKDFCGLDLVSLNIQRGRDHGLPAYPYWREICGLGKLESFDDLKDEIDSSTLEELRQLYKSVDDIDLYIGALSEKPVPQGLLGSTVTCLLADQFWRLKIGDRFWYENIEQPQKFTLDQINEIRKTTLAKIICDTAKIDKSQYFVMKKVGPDNPLQACQDFDYPNLGLWKTKL